MKKLTAISLITCVIFMLVGCGTDAGNTTSSDELTITALEVGKADAFVLHSDTGTVIIDTGTDDEADTLLDYLKDNGITAVDALIISHYDKDHVGGADKLLEAVDVAAVYTTYESKESDDVTEFFAALEDQNLTNTIVRKEMAFTIGSTTYTIYPPEQTSYDEDESNNSSLVVRVENGDYSMLFCGDALEDRIDELLATDGLQSDIIKIPHHGSKIDNLDELIDYIDPSYAIITSSKDDKESDNTMDLLEEAGVETYRTRKGDITIVMSDDGLTISQE